MDGRVPPKPRSPSLPPTLLWSLARREVTLTYMRGPTLQTPRPPCPAQSSLHLTCERKFANRVWTSPAYKQARHQEKFDPPQVLLLDTWGFVGARCKALADPEAIPFLEPSPQPSEQESSFILQCLWSRSMLLS